MNILTIEQVSKSYGEKVLFGDVSFGMDENDKIGVIGVNGTGKSTFLRVIAGLDEPDSGTISINNDVRINFLRQNPDFDPESTVLKAVFEGGDHSLQVVAAYMETMEKLKLNPDDAQLQKDMTTYSTQMDALQAWGLESEAKSILSKLGIQDFTQKMGSLSGGQRKRIALASALILPSELLILDEPTNHIDNASVSWLENVLSRRKGALLLITHDRYFLDRVCNVMLEMDQGRLFRYEANYSRFLELKSEREEREASSEQKRKNLFRTELAWIRRGAKARTTKQKARIDRFEKLKNEKHEFKTDQLDISVASTRLGKQIIEIHDLHKEIAGKILINGLTYIAVPGDRVGIVGPNGIGKSTLLNMIAERIKPDAGEIITGSTVKLGYFTQEHQEMDGKQRVIEYIKDEAEVVTTADGSKITAAQMLERFLFSPTMQWTPIEKLSGGERRRLYLLRVLMSSPNVLLLDEPTNDLDIGTLTVLESYLDEFPGVVFVVSHDRYFLDRTVDKIMAFEGKGNIAVHVGDYSDYEERIQSSVKEKEATQKAEASTKTPKADTSPSSGTSTVKLKFSFNEQREYELIDEQIEQAEQKIALIGQNMELAASDAMELSRLMGELSQAEAELEHLMERWTYLNELAEQIEQQKKQ